MSEWRPGTDGEVCGAQSPLSDFTCTVRLDHDGEHMALLASWPSESTCCRPEVQAAIDQVRERHREALDMLAQSEKEEP